MKDHPAALATWQQAFHYIQDSIGSNYFLAIAKVNIVSASMTSTEFAFFGLSLEPNRLK
jgi:hypothetical protein